MKNVILAAVAASLLIATSAVASDFCEVPKWLKTDKSYIMLMGGGDRSSGKVVDIDKNSCWIVVEDRTRVIQQGIGGQGDMVNVNIRQIISAIELK